MHLRWRLLSANSCVIASERTPVMKCYQIQKEYLTNLFISFLFPELNALFFSLTSKFNRIKPPVFVRFQTTSSQAGWTVSAARQVGHFCSMKNKLKIAQNQAICFVDTLQNTRNFMIHVYYPPPNNNTKTISCAIMVEAKPNRHVTITPARLLTYKYSVSMYSFIS
jgi:hypothetical protein